MLQETNFPFELVIGNDASTDCTGTICADWQKSTRNKSSYSTGRKIWDCNRTSYKPTPNVGDNISPSARAMTSGQTNGNCKSRQISGYASRLFHLFSPGYQLLRRPRNQEPQQWRAEAGYRHIRPCTQQLHLQRIRFVPPGLVRRTARMVCPCQHLRLCHTFAECTIREDTLYKASDGRLPPTRKSNLE